LDFNYFNTEYNEDFVQIHDGYNEFSPQIANISGYYSPPPSYRSSWQYMYVRFTSNYVNSANGFTATFWEDYFGTGTVDVTEATAPSIMTTSSLPVHPFIPNPYMSIDMSGDLISSGAMSQSCARDYSKQFTKTLNTQLEVVQQTITSTPSFCPGATNTELNDAYSFMTIQGTEVLIGFGVDVISFGTTTFDAVSGCSYQVGAYLENFNNWLQPIISDVANCPRLTFRGNNFTIDGLNWVCSP